MEGRDVRAFAELTWVMIGYRLLIHAQGVANFTMRQPTVEFQVKNLLLPVGQLLQNSTNGL